MVSSGFTVCVWSCLVHSTQITSIQFYFQELQIRTSLQICWNSLRIICFHRTSWVAYTHKQRERQTTEKSRATMLLAEWSSQTKCRQRKTNKRKRRRFKSEERNQLKMFPSWIFFHLDIFFRKPFLVHTQQHAVQCTVRVNCYFFLFNDKI